MFDNSRMGLWDDAQNHQTDNQKRAAEGRRRRTLQQEFVAAMHRLGVPPEQHLAKASTVRSRDRYYTDVGSIVGWGLKRTEKSVKTGRYRAEYVIGVDGEFYACDDQPMPQKRGFLQGREPFTPTASVYYGADYEFDYLLRTALAEYMAGRSPVR